MDGGVYLETFLVSAVTAVLGIRLGLSLTGYPQLGGGGLHIAHMLWGGLLMLLAIVGLLAFLGKRVKIVASIAGGLGFGTFIDELGKFVTSDNDYFFQPTVGLLYVLFVTLFLAFRWIDRHHPHSQQEMLVNAADMLKEAIIDGARSDEVNRALALLDQSGLQNGTTEAIRQAVMSADRVGDSPPALVMRMTQAARRGYDRLVGERWVQRGILLVFVVQAIVTLLGAVAAVTIVVIADPFDVMGAGGLPFPAVGYTLASVAVSVLCLVGVARFPRSRLDAYRWFKRAVLVSILLVRVFLFFESELAAIGGLAFDLVLLSGLNAMMRAEHRREEAALPGAANRPSQQLVTDTTGVRAGLPKAEAPSSSPGGRGRSRGQR